MNWGKMSKSKLQKGLHPQDFSSFLLVSSSETFTFNCSFPHSGGKHSARNFAVLQYSSLPQDTPWGTLHLHFTAGETMGHSREGSEQRSGSIVIAGTAGASPAASWHFTFCLTVRHTGWIHYLFHKYHMLSTDQCFITTTSENIATNNFHVWPFVALNLQLLNSLFPGFAFVHV